jgi:riboflavin synthase
MFTGIVTDVGRIVASEKKSHSLRLIIETSLPLERLRIGDSVACNGCCLTVCASFQKPVDPSLPASLCTATGVMYTADAGASAEQVFENLHHSRKNYFECDVGPETLALTRFGKLSAGDEINLEPALCVGDALGGHHVTGHIDTLCEVDSFEPTQDGFYRLRIRVGAPYTKFLILKGSVAVAGVSFTIAQLHDINEKEKIVEIMVIPHTLEKTNLTNTRSHTQIEVEFDTMVKTICSVVESMMHTRI